MTNYTKPTVIPAWAETQVGNAANLVDPGVPFTQGGWPLTTTPPARQHFNWLFNWLSNSVRYFMQHGVVDWDVAETYMTGATVQGPDHLLYQSIADNNTGNVPVSSALFWGSLSTITPLATDNSTRIATTAFVVAVTSLKAPILSPTFTGNPRSVTPIVGDNSTAIATSAFVVNAIAGLATVAYVNASITPLATIAYVNAQVVLKAPILSPAFTGVPTAPTASVGAATSQLATTLFVANGLSSKANTANAQLTGVPVAPTATPGTSSTQLATTAFVQAAVGGTSSFTPSALWAVLGGGLCVQAGQQYMNQGANTVYFPRAFPRACVAVVVNPYGNSGAWAITGVSAGYFTMNSGNAETNYYVAIGY